MLDVVPGPQGGSLGDVLELIRGDTKSWTGTVYAPDGVTLLDLSDYAIQFTAKRRAVDPDAGAVFLKTVLDGITVTGAGKYQIDMMPWDSALLPPKSLALGFDVQIANSMSNVRTIERGLLKVIPDSSIGTSLEELMAVIIGSASYSRTYSRGASLTADIDIVGDSGGRGLCRWISVETGGTVHVVYDDNSEDTFGMYDGQERRLRIKRIKSDSTAQGISVFWE